MAEQLTSQQMAAVNNRGGKLLVSAAAGSGKTKVLVDRLLTYLTDDKEPANVDDFLIITYTKAAASELRGKIAQKLADQIAQQPENKHLQQQLQRIYLANISTVHSFCGDLLREYAYRMDFSPDFRVADENECGRIQDEVMEQMLNDAYVDLYDDEAVRAFIDSQGLGRDDRQIPDIILKVFSSARCHLNPQAWLDQCIQHIAADSVKDASETIWGEYLIARLHNALDGHISALERCASMAAANESMKNPAHLLNDTLLQLQGLRACNTWQQIHDFPPVSYGRLVFGKKCSDTILAEQIKAVRDACKTDIAKHLLNFTDSNEQVLEGLSLSVLPTRGLVELVRRFGKLYEEAKRRYHILDFADLEHKTLDLLVGKHRDHITAAAEQIGQRFREIMVDEYQDSNAVQDEIFKALTYKKQNCFMVGDVKQSIYQFRLADPGIFISKYQEFSPAEEALSGEGRKVLLTKNFRSGAGVISAVNAVFKNCMSHQVGGLAYTEDEMLYADENKVDLEEPEVELHAIQVNDDVYLEEASFVASRIKQMLDSKLTVRDENGVRPVRPGDIVILLRSPGSVGYEFYNALQQAGIKATMGESADLLTSEEVASLINLLQVINNPLQDIPLIGAMTSRLFGFTADELAQMRKFDRNCAFYDCVAEYGNEKELQFIGLIDDLRQIARTQKLNELVHSVLEKTQAYSVFGSLEDGNNKCINLQQFLYLVDNFCSGGQKDLNQLLEYLQLLTENGMSGSVLQSDENTITIMSIHKSKGLEFPVVLLCGLSRSFNLESTRGQVLCDKQLGLGLNVTNIRQRVQYPNIAKRAISARIREQSVSEELRVLYVAMTRARDRLIMTFAKRKLEETLENIANRIALTPSTLMNANVDCPGKWVLHTAIGRTEAGILLKIAGTVIDGVVDPPFWKICYHDIVQVETGYTDSKTEENRKLDSVQLDLMAQSLKFIYPHLEATRIPAKLTATQLKGRSKDLEISQNTNYGSFQNKSFRAPSFVGTEASGTAKGTALHTFMQYANFAACTNECAVRDEAMRLCEENLLTTDQMNMLSFEQVTAFFLSKLGQSVICAKQLLREFKFSLLVDAQQFYPKVSGEQIMVQGVVDCAIIDDDAITVIDFKTDRVDASNYERIAESYRSQIKAYALALERIYEKPVKGAYLYFFKVSKFVEM